LKLYIVLALQQAQQIHCACFTASTMYRVLTRYPAVIAWLGSMTRLESRVLVTRSFIS